MFEHPRRWIAASVVAMALAWWLWPRTVDSSPTPVPATLTPKRTIQTFEPRHAPRIDPVPHLHESARLQDAAQATLAWVEGSVFEADGRPAAEATVFVTGMDGALTAAAVDATGGFRVAVPPGQVKLHAARWDGPVKVESRLDRVHLEPGDTAAVDLELPADFGGEPGIVASMEADGFRVKWVLPHSPARQLGLANGDLVLAIDGQPTTGMSEQSFDAAMVGPEGSEVALLVQFAGPEGGFEEEVSVRRSALDGLWDRPMEDSG